MSAKYLFAICPRETWQALLPKSPKTLCWPSLAGRRLIGKRKSGEGQQHLQSVLTRDWPRTLRVGDMAGWLAKLAVPGFLDYWQGHKIGVVCADMTRDDPLGRISGTLSKGTLKSDLGWSRWLPSLAQGSEAFHRVSGSAITLTQRWNTGTLWFWSVTRLDW